MRNLYMYYKRLKQYITRKQSNPGQEQTGPGSQARANSNTSGRTAGSALSGVSAASSGAGSAISGSSAFSTAAQPEQQTKSAVGDGPKQEQFSLKDDEEIKGLKADNDKKDEPLSKIVIEDLIKKYGISTFAQSEKKLKEIKVERKDLRGKLDQFQREFESVHNRKIRYTKDIVKVQTEFKRYKDLKVDVANIEKVQKYLSK